MNDCDLAVVEPDGEVHDERAPRLEQPRADLILELEQVGGAAELVDGNAVELGVPLGARAASVRSASRTLSQPPVPRRRLSAGGTPAVSSH